MQTHLLEQAAAVITSPQVLVNVISKRVRQLMQGHRPLVEVQPRMGLSDIALAEVIARKLTYTQIPGDVRGLTVVKSAVFTPDRLAA